MNKIKLHIWWSVLAFDSILYGIISSSIAEDNSFINIWAVLRYAVIFGVAIAFEGELTKKFKANKKSLSLLISLLLDGIAIWILGYYISTVVVGNIYYILALTIILLLYIIGIIIINIMSKNYCNECNKNTINEAYKSMDTEMLVDMLESGDAEKRNSVKGAFYVGISAIILSVVYLVIPFFNRLTDIRKDVLIVITAILFILFIIIDERKYTCSNLKKAPMFYIEIISSFIGLVVMFCVDAFVSANTDSNTFSTNFLATIFYAACVMPFIISSKKASFIFK